MVQVSSTTKNPKTSRGRKTRQKLLDAAEAEFGEKGFHDGSISGITQRAGVALGTFYTYFKSKEEIFQALVAYMSRRIREWIGERVAEATDRLIAERLGIEKAARNDEIRSGDYEAWAWAIMGIAVFLGMRFVIMDESKSPSEVADLMTDLIANGIR